MPKVKREAMFLYKGFRPYVPKKKLAEYDSAFASRKVHTVKFMTSLINNNVNIKYYHKHPKDPDDGYLFNFFILEFSQRGSKISKAFEEFKNTRSNMDTNFLFFNAHP